jgi:NADH:ubiquinone oxidoreductase subunit F (NADH-binding)
VINNVESIASVPSIIANGDDWFSSMGTDKSKGMTIYSLSGHVANPGQFEAPLGITLRELLDLAGGIRAGHRLKFWTPGGSSTPMLTDAHLDVPLDYEAIAGVKSMLGTKALQCFDETTSVVRVVLRWTEFYKHESCGKCTPCREGTWWLVQILKRLEAGRGEPGDIEKLLDLATTSSAALSAPSATAQHRPSRLPSSTSETSSRPPCTLPPGSSSLTSAARSSSVSQQELEHDCYSSRRCHRLRGRAAA